jgi:hypothetical protein
VAFSAKILLRRSQPTSEVGHSRDSNSVNSKQVGSHLLRERRGAYNTNTHSFVAQDFSRRLKLRKREIAHRSSCGVVATFLGALIGELDHLRVMDARGALEGVLVGLVPELGVQDCGREVGLAGPVDVVRLYTQVADAQLAIDAAAGVGGDDQLAAHEAGDALQPVQVLQAITFKHVNSPGKSKGVVSMDFSRNEVSPVPDVGRDGEVGDVGKVYDSALFNLLVGDLPVARAEDDADVKLFNSSSFS